MLAAIRREPSDRLTFAPRLDLWHTARSASGTLPREYAGLSSDEICRREGWGIFRLTGDYRYMSRERTDWPFVALGLFNPPETVYSLGFSSAVETVTRELEDEFHVEFRTGLGTLTATLELTESMHRDGITYPMVTKRPVVTSEDMRIAASLFENLVVSPRHEGFQRSEAEIADLGVTVSQAVDAASPIHQIQKYILDPTEFFLYYRERRRDLDELAESVAHYFDQVLDIYAASPVEVAEWGSNYDRTITFPPYFERDILPWLRKAADRLHQEGKLLITHCDGENDGLMELIASSGVDGAESVCPFPMTRLKLHEYVEQWADRMAIIGGIPAEYLIAEMRSEKELDDYLTYMLRAVAPGTAFIPGVTDAVSPLTDFDRLRRVADFLEGNGALPLPVGPMPDIFPPERGARTGVTGSADEGAERGAEKGGGNADEAVSEVERTAEDPSEDPSEESSRGPIFAGLDAVRRELLRGDQAGVQMHVAELLAAGVPAQQILEDGMIATMDYVGEAFGRGELYIPEMLRAARAMEAGVEVLKAGLLNGGASLDMGTTVLLGTVFGDLHDIGKNLVALMLRGVGCDVVDLGINVAAQTFADEVERRRPGVVALSALLTTTMPQMQAVIGLLGQRGLRGQVDVIVGGAPVTPEFAEHVGADGYAPNAGEAGALTQRLRARRAQGPAA